MSNTLFALAVYVLIYVAAKTVSRYERDYWLVENYRRWLMKHSFQRVPDGTE